VIVALQAGQQVHQLVQMLHSQYYLDEQAFQDAVQRGILYGVLHLTTMMKVDLIPLKQRAFSQEEARRAQPTAPPRLLSASMSIHTSDTKVSSCLTQNLLG